MQGKMPVLIPRNFVGEFERLSTKAVLMDLVWRLCKSHYGNRITANRIRAELKLIRNIHETARKAGAR